MEFRRMHAILSLSKTFVHLAVRRRHPAAKPARGPKGNVMPRAVQAVRSQLDWDAMRTCVVAGCSCSVPRVILYFISNNNGCRSAHPTVHLTLRDLAQQTVWIRALSAWSLLSFVQLFECHRSSPVRPWKQSTLPLTPKHAHHQLLLIPCQPRIYYFNFNCTLPLGFSTSLPNPPFATRCPPDKRFYLELPSLPSLWRACATRPITSRSASGVSRCQTAPQAPSRTLSPESNPFGMQRHWTT
jgi:hypothetical protein